MVDLDGRPAPEIPPFTGWVARGGALGICAVNGGTFFGAFTMLGLPRLARAVLTLVSRWDGGNRWPCTRAGGVICLRPAFRFNTVCGATTLLILVMLTLLLLIVWLITVWLMLVTREM
jgi:hypothetical protein